MGVERIWCKLFSIRPIQDSVRSLGFWKDGKVFQENNNNDDPSTLFVYDVAQKSSPMNFSGSPTSKSNRKKEK